jgi:hypothetical protein
VVVVALQTGAAAPDPIGTIRDAVKNEIIEFPIEHGRAQFEDGFASIGLRSSWSYYPHLDELIEVFSKSTRERIPASV